MNDEQLKTLELAAKGIIANMPGRVRRTTVRCTGCGLIREGELLHGSRCPRCEMGVFENVALIREGDRP